MNLRRFSADDMDFVSDDNSTPMDAEIEKLQNDIRDFNNGRSQAKKLLEKKLEKKRRLREAALQRKKNAEESESEESESEESEESEEEQL